MVVMGVMAAMVSMIFMSGCSRATVLGPSPGDALRAENQQLRDQSERLSLQVKELESKLAESRRGSRPDAPTTSSEVEAAMPRIASVQIEGATEVVRSGGAAEEAVLRLWILPRDGRGRFLQIVGRLSVGVASLRADAPPVEVARASFDPVQVRDAWRSGLMGSHYAFEVPLRLPPSSLGGPITVSIRFDDAQTGRVFEDERRLAAPREVTATMSAGATSR